MSLLFGPKKQNGNWPKFSNVQEKELGEVFSDNLIEGLRRIKAEYSYQVERPTTIKNLIGNAGAVEKANKRLEIALQSITKVRGLPCIAYSGIYEAIRRDLPECKKWEGKAKKQKKGRPKDLLKRWAEGEVAALFKSFKIDYNLRSDHEDARNPKETQANLAVRAVLGVPRTMRVSHLKPAPKIR